MAYGPHRSPEETVQINNHISLYHNINEEKKNPFCTLWELMIFHLNKTESPSPIVKGLCQDWLKLAQWFLRKRFLNFVDEFSPFRYYLPLEKDGTLHLINLESTSPKDALCRVGLKLKLKLVKIGSVVLKKKMKTWIVYDNANNDDDDGQRTNFVQKNSLEPSA